MKKIKVTQYNWKKLQPKQPSQEKLKPYWAHSPADKIPSKTAFGAEVKIIKAKEVKK